MGIGIPYPPNLFPIYSTLYANSAKQRQNFVVYCGEHKNIEITVVSPDGTPQDISGCAVEWQAIYNFTDPLLWPASMVKSTAAASILVNDPENGKFILCFEPEDTIGKGGRYYHEAQITDITGAKLTVLTGTLLVQPSAIGPTV